jgi:hypothetical protein
LLLGDIQILENLKTLVIAVTVESVDVVGTSNCEAGARFGRSFNQSCAVRLRRCEQSHWRCAALTLSQSLSTVSNCEAIASRHLGLQDVIIVSLNGTISSGDIASGRVCGIRVTDGLIGKDCTSGA